MGQCIKTICSASIWGKTGHRCKNHARYGNYCGTHSPEKQKERRENRGPTHDEQRWEIEKAERARVKALESSHAELLKAMYKIRSTFDPDVRDRIAYEAIKRVEEKQ